MKSAPPARHALAAIKPPRRASAVLASRPRRHAGDPDDQADPRAIAEAGDARHAALGQGLVAALRAAVRLASITSGADEEEAVALEHASAEPGSRNRATALKRDGEAVERLLVLKWGPDVADLLRFAGDRVRRGEPRPDGAQESKRKAGAVAVGAAVVASPTIGSNSSILSV